jgi:hypothetical protein
MKEEKFYKETQCHKKYKRRHNKETKMNTRKEKARNRNII